MNTLLQLLQDLERDGFNTLTQSADRTDVIYQYFKLAMYEGRLEVCQSKLLMREVRELEYIDKKVDHPEVTKADLLTYGRGSKDVADATAESIYAMTYNLEAFTNISKHYNRESYMMSMRIKSITSKDNIMKEMKSISKTGGMDRFLRKEHERVSLLVPPDKVKLSTDRSHRKFKSQYMRIDDSTGENTNK